MDHFFCIKKEQVEDQEHDSMVASQVTNQNPKPLAFPTGKTRQDYDIQLIGPLL